MESTKKYWLIIEPYVYINLTEENVLLYNTLDSAFIESSQIEVIDLIRELLKEENVGVIRIKTKQLAEQPVIKIFIDELREKFMGDLVDQSLSNGRPVQILPFINYPTWSNRGCDLNFLNDRSQMLFEITIHLDSNSNVHKLKEYLQIIPENTAIILAGNWQDITDIDQLLEYLQHRSSTPIIDCSYTQIPTLNAKYISGFEYRVSVYFPINHCLWEKAMQLRLDWNGSVGYCFKVTSEADCLMAEQLIEVYAIENYQISPHYTGHNLDFFKENIYLTHDDILASSLSMKELFKRRTLNQNDFGKLHILPNGDICANIHHPVLGNITAHSIYAIIQKEIEEGISWLRVRNQDPCATCLYRDLCPSPSDYELEIGHPNLCYIK